MKVLLLQSVKRLGEAGKIVDAKSGYAINYLIPNKLATTDLEFKVNNPKKGLSKEEISSILKKIKKLSLKFEKKANDQGVLFSGINQKEVEVEIKDRLASPNLALNVQLDGHLKNAGDYMVPVSIDGQETQVKVSIIPLKLS